MTVVAADLLINVSELPRPRDVVEKLPMIKAIVIRAVDLGMVGWRQHCHLVTIDGVAAEEMLHFVCNLQQFKTRPLRHCSGHYDTALATTTLLRPLRH